MTGALTIFRAAALDGLPHGFCGRTGGVSEGVFASLNTGPGSGDAPDAIAENRGRVVAALAPGAALLTPYQVHGARCITIDRAWAPDERPEADALVTDRPGLLLGILTADCAPVLFADQAAGVVGAAHAGWKGAFNGVTDIVVAAMVALGARLDRIAAAIGPCIARASYEVDEAFRDRFLAADPANAACFDEGAPGHAGFDLEAYVAARLTAAGVGQVERLGLDTLSNPARFFSYRRATLAGETAYGRQLSVIAL